MTYAVTPEFLEEVKTRPHGAEGSARTFDDREERSEGERRTENARFNVRDRVGELRHLPGNHGEPQITAVEFNGGIRRTGGA